MLISDIRVLGADRSVGYCWQTIRRFQNVDFVTEFLKDLHQIPLKYACDAKKQASQIRQCLIQGSEYFAAAKGVTIATKPVLYYYAIMSFALAEILIKQDGKSSLDKAREIHKHHGLHFKVSCFNDPKVPLGLSAAALSASPAQSGKDQRYGTFELWHQSARQLPVVAV